MTSDSIFLILQLFLGRFIIYEIRIIRGKNETLVVDYLGNFGDTSYGMIFCPVIKSRENGKFIFSQQVTRRSQTELIDQKKFTEVPLITCPKF